MLENYKLYALPFSYDNINLLSGEEYIRATERYILVYTDHEVGTHGTEISEKEVRRLTAADTVWLEESMFSAMIECVKENREAAENLKEKIEKLEQALKSEKEKLIARENADER